MDVPEIGPRWAQRVPVLHLTGLSVQVIAALLVPALSIAVVSFTDVMITSQASAGEAMPEAPHRRCAPWRRPSSPQASRGALSRCPSPPHVRRWPMRPIRTTRFYTVFVVVVVISGAAAATGRDRSGSRGRTGRRDRLRRPDLVCGLVRSNGRVSPPALSEPRPLSR